MRDEYQLRLELFDWPRLCFCGVHWSATASTASTSNNVGAASWLHCVDWAWDVQSRFGCVAVRVLHAYLLNVGKLLGREHRDPIWVPPFCVR